MSRPQSIPQAFGCKLVSIAKNGNYYRLCLSIKLFSDRKQRYIPLAACCDLEGLQYAQSRQLEIESAIAKGNFDPTLEAYRGWKLIKGADIQPYTAEQCNVLTLDRLWDDWVNYKEPLLSKSTCKVKLRGTYQRALIKFGQHEPINAHTAIALRNYLIENLNRQDAINLLRELDNACKRVVNLGDSSLTNNPFYGMSKTVASIRNAKIDRRTADEIIKDGDGIISFTPEQQELILDRFSKSYPHYYLFVYFRFLTGVRLQESLELRWRDITSDFTKIVISRAYDSTTGEIKATKTGKYRTFLCGNELIGLLRNYYYSLSELDRDKENLLFRNSKGWRIHQRSFNKIWNKVISQLVDEKILAKKLAPKNTRHTFATRARLAGYSREEVARQLGHSPAVEDRNYLDTSQIDRPLEF